MDFSRIPLLDAIRTRMHWLNRNQEILSQNIANADTPGYKAKELEKPDFAALVAATERRARHFSSGDGPPPVTLQATSPLHFGTGSQIDEGARVRTADPEEVQPNGNAVDLERQLLEVSKTQMDYGLMVNLYRKQVSLLKMALGRGSGR
ncbi:MAG: flagellar basal body rod protein FlgB [Alphaproteobacteria bacterium]|nr:MAG: flagellar basal body rod protein FlgB [Alphaproteobacteria bacterium]